MHHNTPSKAQTTEPLGTRNGEGPLDRPPKFSLLRNMQRVRRGGESRTLCRLCWRPEAESTGSLQEFSIFEKEDAAARSLRHP